MGVYVYTMRKATKKLTLPTGQKVDARFYSYAYKPNYSFSEPREHKRFVGSMERRALDAFDSYDNGYVIVGDQGESLDGAYVYRGVRHATWADCNEFPGEAVGIVTIKGNRAFMFQTTEWAPFQGIPDREYRLVVKDGKIVSEGRFTSDKLPIIVGETVDEQGNRLHA